MEKAIYFSIDKDRNELRLFNYNNRNVNENDKIQKLPNYGSIARIEAYIYGKILGGGIRYEYGNIIHLTFPFNFIAEIGILNSTKQLLQFIECMKFKKVKKIYIKEKEINIKEEKSLLSLGIKEDCSNCKVEFEENNFL